MAAVLMAASAGCGGDSAGTTGATVPSALLGELAWPPAGTVVGFNDAAYRTGQKGVTAESTAAWAQAAGATSHRLVVDWRSLEPRPGAWSEEALQPFRKLAAAVEATSGRVLVTLGLTPDWAQDRIEICQGCHAPPAEQRDVLRAWDRYVERVARAFPRALAFEVWNEPNFAQFWAPRPDPARYARLVRRTAATLRRVAPDADVLAGAVVSVPRDLPEPGIMRGSTFLRQAFAAGLRGSYDGLSWHAYPAQGAAGAERPGPGSWYDRSVRDVQDAIAELDRRAPQWVTETGVSTTGPGGVTPDRQAALLDALLERLADARNVRAVYVHKLFDALVHPDSSRERGFGVVGMSDEGPVPKPSFCLLNLAGVGSPTPPAGSCTIEG